MPDELLSTHNIFVSDDFDTDLPDELPVTEDDVVEKDDGGVGEDEVADENDSDEEEEDEEEEDLGWSDDGDM